MFCLHFRLNEASSRTLRRFSAAAVKAAFATGFTELSEQSVSRHVGAC